MASEVFSVFNDAVSGIKRLLGTSAKEKFAFCSFFGLTFAVINAQNRMDFVDKFIAGIIYFSWAVFIQAVRAVILGRGCHLPDPLCCGHYVLWSVLPFQESMVHKHYPQVRRVPVADILYERCTYFRDYFLPGDFKLGFHEEQLQISTVSRSKEGRANAS